MDYIPPVIGIIRDNMVAKGNPLGLPPKAFTAWAEGLDLPRQGKRFLYTGLEYQMMPYSYGLQEIVKRSGPFTERMAAVGAVKGIFDKIGIDVGRAFTTAKNQELFHDILRKFVHVFHKLGVELAYLYEDEPYVGGLLYEFGFQDLAIEHGRKIAKLFDERGVEEAVVISPHALEMFRKVYPTLGVTFNTKFVHYTEVLAEHYKSGAVSPRELAIHDPCHLARSLRITEEPRQVLGRVEGVNLKEVTHTNKYYTGCCGAPVEVYLPAITELVAGARLGEFAKEGLKQVLVLCPFCYYNLTKQAADEKLDIKVTDYIEVVSESLGG